MRVHPAGVNVRAVPGMGKTAHAAAMPQVKDKVAQIGDPVTAEARMRRNLISLLLAVAVLLVQDAAAQERLSLRPARNVVYAEASTLLLTGNLSVNYERWLSDHISARVGVGAGYRFCLEYGCDAQLGAVAMLLFSPSRSEYKFEAGLGASYVGSGTDICPRVCPAVTFGYRHQRARGGFVFRVGVNWTYAYGFPFQVSVGHAF